MLNILYSGFGAEELNEIHSKLTMSVDLKPVYVLAQSVTLLNAEFEGAIKHEIFDSRNGKFPTELSLTLRGASTDAVDEYLNSFKDIAIAMMGRQSDSSWSFSFSEREHFFYMLACYWEQVLSAKKIEIAVSRNVPHFASEYILAKLCQYKGVPFIQVDTIPALNRSFFISSLGSRLTSTEYFDGSLKECSSSVSAAINKNLCTYENAKAEYYLRTEQRRQRALSWKYLLKEMASLIFSFSIFVNRAIFKKELVVSSNIKRNRRPIYKKVSQHNAFSLNLHKWKVRYYIYKNRCHYHKMISTVDLNEKYVLFAANYQPERTTMPDGGQYYDVLRALGTLASVLPEGWKILYKEHPSVFNWPGDTFYRGHLFRNEEFYCTLHQFDRVVCVDPEFDTFKLIDHALAVCCITGTIAYQASIRGVKSIVFGDSWVAGCPLIHEFESREALKDFLRSKTGDAGASVEIWSKFLEECWSKSFPAVDLLSASANKEVYVSCLLKYLTDSDFI